MPSIDPTPAQLEDLAARVATVTGPIRMINLLRFREVADYGDAPDPAETGSSTGAEAYARYGQVAMAEVAAVGGSQFEAAAAHMTVIGPEDESWDLSKEGQHEGNNPQRLPRVFGASGQAGLDVLGNVVRCFHSFFFLCHVISL